MPTQNILQPPNAEAIPSQNPEVRGLRVRDGVRSYLGKVSHRDASKDTHITALRWEPVGVREMLWSGTDPNIILSADLHPRSRLSTDPSVLSRYYC